MLGVKVEEVEDSRDEVRMVEDEEESATVS